MFQSGDVEQDLRRRARDALDAEILPPIRPTRTWGGSGSGNVCPVCGRIIVSEEMELELEFATADVAKARREYHLHLPCFEAWVFVRDAAAGDRA